MSSNSAPLSSEPLFLAPPAVVETPPAGHMIHHPQAKPAEYLCTCGKVREACVHDEVRAMWQAIADE
jgi:hypothetical protein